MLERSRSVVEQRQGGTVGSVWEVGRLLVTGSGELPVLCLDEGFEKPSTNNCNFLFALW